MWLAAIDPQWPPIIAALAALATALGLNERRRRQRIREQDNENNIDRRAAETILTQWKAVLEGAQAEREWAVSQLRRCEERHQMAIEREEALKEKLKQWEWEMARRDWLDQQKRKR